MLWPVVWVSGLRAGPQSTCKAGDKVALVESCCRSIRSSCRGLLWGVLWRPHLHAGVGGGGPWDRRPEKPDLQNCSTERDKKGAGEAPDGKRETRPVLGTGTQAQ